MYRLSKIIGGTSSHLGALCSIRAKQTQLAKDFGLTNLIIIETRLPLDEAKKWDKKLFHVVLDYNDGYERDLGLKAVVKVEDGIKLYGSSTIYYLKNED